MDLARRRSELIAELEPFSDHHERFQYVIDRAKSAPALPADLKLEAFLIEGCTSNGKKRKEMENREKVKEVKAHK